jgi:ABC transporter substrate binding protein (PQQ-dependent alcohol dehydrogenase system)
MRSKIIGAVRPALVLLFALAVPSAPGLAEELREFVIGYLEGDRPEEIEWNRHPADMAHMPDYVPHRPAAGAAKGVGDAQYLGRSMKLKYALEVRKGAGADELTAALEDLAAQRQAKVFLIDAPGPVVAEVAKASADRGVLLFNVAAEDDELRNEWCQRHLYHTMPSHAMLMDSLVQYLLVRKWRRVLVVKGPLERDAAVTKAFERAAKRFAAKIVDIRPFLLTQDPRAREVNRVEQLTALEEYDVVFVADAHGEFSYRIPYRTVLPRPVVGRTGLVPRAWHWSYLRHGAPQVNSRFERDNGRRMSDADWAAWVAVKVVSEAILRTRSTEVADIVAYLQDQTIRLDGFKGGPHSFRPWNNQMRQKLLLTTPDWVVAVTPLPAFLHAVNPLDTLGYDERDSTCRF